MTDQLSEIGSRLRELRNVMDVPAGKMASDMKLSEEEYTAYERGERDFSFSFLFNAANLLGVDVLDIMSGETPKLTSCAFVKKGEGYDVARREAYGYKHLAFTFSKKKAEPFMVTVEPEKNGKMSMHSHEGQEFDYMVSGKMEFHLGEMTYELEEGDSVYYDSGLPHAMKSVGPQTAKFIAVVIK